jgi:hypothetical protein
MKYQFFHYLDLFDIRHGIIRAGTYTIYIGRSCHFRRWQYWATIDAWGIDLGFVSIVKWMH